MDRAILSEKAPKPIGPYSQAVRCGAMVFTSGQIPLDPSTGALVKGGIEDQGRQAIENLKAVLEAAGLTLSNVVKTTVYLQNIGDFAAFNKVYAGYFPAQPPARSVVQVAALPMGAQVEIEAVTGPA